MNGGCQGFGECSFPAACSDPQGEESGGLCECCTCVCVSVAGWTGGGKRKGFMIWIVWHCENRR